MTVSNLISDHFESDRVEKRERSNFGDQETKQIPHNFDIFLIYFENRVDQRYFRYQNAELGQERALWSTEYSYSIVS